MKNAQGRKGAGRGSTGLEASRHQLTTFTEIGKALTSSLDLKEVLRIVMEKVRDLLHPESWSLLLLDEATGELRYELAVGKGTDKLKDTTVKAGEGIAGMVALEMKPLLVPDISKDPRFSGKAGEGKAFASQSIVCVPLITRGKCLGAVELVNRAGGFSGDDLLALTTIADFTAIAIENAIFFNRVRELTITDDLTKLYNLRFLHSRLNYEFERAKRFGYSLSLIFFDLDRFKEVNDRHGHTLGNALLVEVASLTASMLRAVDTACRYGGDEFVILMPETAKKNAALVAGKIRSAMNAKLFLAGEGINLKLTASFGVASFPEDAPDMDGLIRKADDAMYRVKNSTKDGVSEA